MMLEKDEQAVLCGNYKKIDNFLTKKCIFQLLFFVFYAKMSLCDYSLSDTLQQSIM